MTAGFTLRAAHADDTARVVAVQPQWWGGRDLTGLIQPLFLANFASTSLVAEDDGGRMVGFLIGFPSADAPEDAYVHFVGVAPQARGAGLGRELHDAFAQRMSARGVRRVRCVTSPVNDASIAFHQSIGFAVESRDEEAVRFVRESAGVRFVPRVDPRPGDTAWGEATWPLPEGLVLRGDHVTLTRSVPEDAYAMFRALDDSEVWAHVRGRPETADQLAQSLAAASGSGRYPWTVRQGTRVVGTTSFLEVFPTDARLEIGFTLYARDVWATAVNPECKLLLMGWAFDHGFGRVQLKTDVRNTRSQQAISRLGATFEGVLRRYQRRADGTVRDSVLFSVTAEDWPDVRAGLVARLA